MMMLGLPVFAKRKLGLVVIVALASLVNAAAFIPTTRNWRITDPSCNNSVLVRAAKKSDDSSASSKKDSKESSRDAPDPLIKTSWFAVETFGKVFGSNKAKKNKDDKSPVAIDYDKPPTSVEETIQRIQVDNDREYFLSGQIDELIYDMDCTFADPFVSFKGRDRFVENLKNLGSFITKYSAKPLNYQVEENAVETRFLVKLELNLPWKPVLAWPWGVRCEIDPDTNLIVLHQEKWDIEAWDGVKQIFRKPTVTI